MTLPVRRQYRGAAASTTITINILAGDTSVSIASNTGWPSSAGVPFYVVIDPGTSAEEKCLATISGTSLTLTRAQDGTTAQTHTSGAVIYPVFTAVDADEANELASKMTTKGDLLTTNGTDINRLGVGTNAHALIADSTATNGVKWGQVETAGIADSAVTSAKIADGTIVAGDLAADAVETAKIKDLNVTTAKIADGAVTGVKLAATAAIQPTIVDAKGDLIAGTAADTVDRLAIGTNGHVLTADSAASTGMKWAAVTAVMKGSGSTASVATSQTTTSTTYTDLATTGPSVTVTTDTAALVIVTATIAGSGTDPQGFMGFDVSGATTIAAADTAALRTFIVNAGTATRASAVYLLTVTAGSNVFTAKYKRSGGTNASFADRQITVFPV